MPNGPEGNPSLKPDLSGTPESEHSYHDKAEINGLKFDVRWSDLDGFYEIYFPQNDRAISISSNPESAKKVFDFAAKTAEKESDVNKVCQEVEKLVEQIVMEELG